MTYSQFLLAAFPSEPFEFKEALQKAVKHQVKLFPNKDKRKTHRIAFDFAGVRSLNPAQYIHVQKQMHHLYNLGFIVETENDEAFLENFIVYS